MLAAWTPVVRDDPGAAGQHDASCARSRTTFPDMHRPSLTLVDEPQCSYVRVRLQHTPPPTI